MFEILWKFYLFSYKYDYFCTVYFYMVFGAYFPNVNSLGQISPRLVFILGHQRICVCRFLLFVCLSHAFLDVLVFVSSC